LLGIAAIKPIGEDAVRVITINETTIVVNDVAPKLPLDGAQVESHTGNGWVVVEKRTDGLYVGGNKVVLYLSRRQQGSKSLNGYELRDEPTRKPVFNANLLDALLENPHLIPEDWKKDGEGYTRHIFFWGTIYRSPGGDPFVYSLFWSDDGWHRGSRFLLDVWNVARPAALRAVPTGRQAS